MITGNKTLTRLFKDIAELDEKDGGTTNREKIYRWAVIPELSEDILTTEELL